MNDPALVPAPDAAPVLALWAANLNHWVRDRADWLALVEEQVGKARRHGAHLFVMPEYISAHWLHWADQSIGRPLSGKPLMDWMAAEGKALLPELERLARRYRIGIVAGTMPVAAEAGPEAGNFNRAWILLPQPDGSLHRLHHDKLAPTPSERPDGDWPIRLGRRVTPFEFMGARMAVLICLDVEIPAVAAKLQGEALDLLIVPSMTGQLSGYHRVFDCAKARAVELFAAVATVGAIGTIAQNQGGNCSGAALFLPCEIQLGGNGRAAALAPQAEIEGPGPLLVMELPLAALRRARRYAEAWPGPFDASHVEIARGAAPAELPRRNAAQ